MSDAITNAWIDDPQRQCRGKVGFNSKAKAKLSARRHGNHRQLRAYRCPHCGWFHLGARPTHTTREGGA